MKARELIEELLKFDTEKEVAMICEGGCVTVNTDEVKYNEETDEIEISEKFGL